MAIGHVLAPDHRYEGNSASNLADGKTRMATEGPFKKMEGELIKPYVLCRIGENDEIIERLAEGESVEDLFKAHRRQLNSKYAVYHHGKRLFLPGGG